jgi:type I site-specific restriction endonuclease
MMREDRRAAYGSAEFSLVIADEAHHFVAPMFAEVVNYFYPAILVGMTATCDRTDAVPLRQIFDHVPDGAYYGIVEAIRDGWLCPIKQQHIRVDLDFSKVRQSSGDLSAEALDEIISQEEFAHNIAAPTVKLAGDRPTIVFTPRVASAEMVAGLINRYAGSGSAHAVSGQTPLDLRREIVSDFRHERHQFMVNAMLWTEGVDFPHVSCIVIARPSKSRMLVAQMIGRGLRGGFNCPVPDKSDCLVVDLVGASRHKLVTAVDLLGGDFTAEVVEEAHRRVDEQAEAGEAPDVLGELLAAEQIKDELERQRRIKVLAEAKLKTKTIDPFITADLPERAVPDWWEGDPVTAKQTETLKKNGVPLAGLDYGRAKQLCDEIARRASEGECSFKMARILGSHGYDRHFPMELAGEIMGWFGSRPQGFRFARHEGVRLGLLKAGKVKPISPAEWIRKRYTWGLPEPEEKPAPVESGGPPEGWF